MYSFNFDIILTDFCKTFVVLFFSDSFLKENVVESEGEKNREKGG